MMQSTLDIVWLKRDIRLSDHGPLAEVASSNHPLLILYNYEPDQLSESSVHGSHISFVNEGLIDLDQKLSTSSSSSLSPSSSSSLSFHDTTSRYTFHCITVCYAGVVDTLESIHQQIQTGTIYLNLSHSNTKNSSTTTTNHNLNSQRIQLTGINRILSHEETGHFQSYVRDKAVRKWCREKGIHIHEYNQTGVTRCLKSRDDFSKLFTKYIQQPLWKTPSTSQLIQMRSRLIISSGCQELKLPNVCSRPLYPHLNEIEEIPLEHRQDRTQRQNGGETLGVSTLNSFLYNRGRHYSCGISSPNSSWTTCARISPYITWGHLSTRYVIQMLLRRQGELRRSSSSFYKPSSSSSLDSSNHSKQQLTTTITATTLQPSSNNHYNVSSFLKSLSAFSSRIHWRSHYIQKLESEPDLEHHDLCSAYQHLRRQDGDWNEDYYQKWTTGTTGFPFVDACMRCLIQHGWINFRMRAMLVSFATYNLWLDWKRIAPHLARVFLDYEPGIHYPQLQMQAGTTGINAMRVYSVTKQGKDQDPNGVFVKKYVPELQNVPVEYIHEPSLMPRSLQERYNVIIGTESDEDKNRENSINNTTKQIPSAFSPAATCNTNTATTSKNIKSTKYHYYPRPIVNEKESAKIAKEKMNNVRKMGCTKRIAEQVYIKHGSRSARSGNMEGAKPKALSSIAKRVKLDESMENGHCTIHKLFQRINEKAREDKLVNDAEKKISCDVSVSYKETKCIDSVNEQNDKIVANSSDLKQVIDMEKGQTIRKLFQRMNEKAKGDNFVNDTEKKVNSNNMTIFNSEIKCRYSDHDKKIANEFKSKQEIDMRHFLKKKGGDDVLVLKSENVYGSCSQIQTNLPVPVENTDKVTATFTCEEIIEESWICSACTFLNDKPLGLSCTICGTFRYSEK